MTGRPSRGRTAGARRRGDDGGVWIVTGVVCGILLYGFIVLMDVAGFTSVLPLVVVPPILVGMIGANSLLGGGRRPGRPAAPPTGEGSRPPAAGSNGSSAGGPPGPS